MDARIAIVDDELTVCRRLQKALAKEGYEVETFQAAEPFLEGMIRAHFQVIFLDLRLSDSNGMKLLSEIKRRWEQAEVVIITGYGSIDSAVEAIQKGAYHYLTKPLKLDDVRLLAERALEKVRLRQEVDTLKKVLGGQRSSFNGLIGTSTVLRSRLSNLLSDSESIE